MRSVRSRRSFLPHNAEDASFCFFSAFLTLLLVGPLRSFSARSAPSASSYTLGFPALREIFSRNLVSRSFLRARSATPLSALSEALLGSLLAALLGCIKEQAQQPLASVLASCVLLGGGGLRAALARFLEHIGINFFKARIFFFFLFNRAKATSMEKTRFHFSDSYRGPCVR